MDFMLVDNAGNAVEAFDTDADAHRGFVALIRDDPTFAKSLALLAFDRDGIAVGDPLIAADLLPDAVTTTTVNGPGWTKLRDAVGATFVLWSESVAILATLPENGATVLPAAQVA